MARLKAASLENSFQPLIYATKSPMKTGASIIQGRKA